jgi:hypothetical protein
MTAEEEDEFYDEEYDAYDRFDEEEEAQAWPDDDVY